MIINTETITNYHFVIAKSLVKRCNGMTFRFCSIHQFHLLRLKWGISSLYMACDATQFLFGILIMFFFFILVGICHIYNSVCVRCHVTENNSSTRWMGMASHYYCFCLPRCWNISGNIPYAKLLFFKEDLIHFQHTYQYAFWHQFVEQFAITY